MVHIDHFSDLLCVWAYVADIRMRELQENFDASIVCEFRFLNVFGDAPTKLNKGWTDRGGLQGYAEHVQQVAAGFEHVSVHADAWAKVAPCSSMASHLWICGARVAEEEGHLQKGAAVKLAWALREAFFANARDISSRQVQVDVSRQSQVDDQAIAQSIDKGQAHALLSADLSLAQRYQVQVSPTLVFNEGRQRLAGNVGYRIIEANITELIDVPEAQHSWC